MTKKTASKPTSKKEVDLKSLPPHLRRPEEARRNAAAAAPTSGKS